jgi:alkaline phosphatase D
MKIAITSCSKIQQISPQPVWSDIKKERPDVLMLLGDNIYLNKDKHKDPNKLQSELRMLYQQQLNEPNFKALLADLHERGGKLLAIYDDHDFIGNNRYGGDSDLELGKIARKELINAFSIPTTNDDVYSLTQTGLVDIIMLDERFYRRSVKASRNDRDAILGAQQWTWLEHTVKKSQAKYLLIGSSSTFHHFIGESWERYRGAFSRMRSLLREKKGHVIFSGDVHRNAMYDDSGVMEIVTSAVARNSVVFGKKRQNYCIATFSEDAMHIDLRSLKSGWRFNTTVSLNNWEL